MMFVASFASSVTSSERRPERRRLSDAGHGRRRRRAAVLVLSAVVAGALAACASGWGKRPPAGADIPQVAWPEPPDPARIELVGVFAEPSDLGIEGSVWSRLADLMSGGADHRMLRPAGLTASGSLVAVADPAGGVVHVYESSRQRARILRACGDMALAEPVAVVVLAGRLYVSDASLAQIAVFDVDGGCAGTWVLEPGSRPAGLAADPERSRVYVADVGLHRVLAFDTQGHELLRLGSRGAGAGEFNYPTWVAVDGAGQVYVTDALNFRVQIFDSSGGPIGGFGRQGDGSGAMARPKGIGVDREGNIYLVDALFDAVQVFDHAGHYLMVFGGTGREPGHFWLPSGLAIDGDRIYVADSYNQRVQVFRFLGGEP